jgi:peptide/nickel transport system substrate-binding protein
MALAVLLVTGCGSSSEQSSSHRTLTGSYTSFPDYLDPALSFTAEGWSAMQNVYIPLLTYRHASGDAGTELIPGLARELPKISKDGKAYTLYLRRGLRYSNGKPVKASDFRFAIERMYRVNSPGATYYTDIVGAEEFAKTKKGRISGIETDDASGRITIRLNEPSGIFSYLLALLFAAPVPADTPAEDQTATPPPATGPYVISEVKPGRHWAFRRNPVWEQVNSKAMPDLPSGHVDSIEITVQPNPLTQLHDVETGKIDYAKNPPPPDRYPEVTESFEGSQLRIEPTISVYYFWMNSQEPPFDDVRVRRAVNYAIDPAALERIYAGSISATQQILPTRMPGYREFELYPHDMGKAKQLIAQANPSDRDITIWTNDLEPNDEAGEYYDQVLRQLGFHTKLKTVSATNYFTIIGNQSTPDLDTGWANWFLDYPHPNDYFAPQLSGKSIVPVGNTNWARFDDPAINAKIERLGREQLGPQQEAEYADLDEEVMKQAPWAPFGSLSFANFVAPQIDLEKVIFSPIFNQDLTSFEFDE